MTHFPQDSVGQLKTRVIYDVLCDEFKYRLFVLRNYLTHGIVPSKITDRLLASQYLGFARIKIGYKKKDDS